MPKKIPGTRCTFPVVQLESGLAAEVSLLLLDPTTKRMRWGAWQNLISTLVRKWVEEQRYDSTDANALRNTPHRNMNHE